MIEFVERKRSITDNQTKYFIDTVKIFDLLEDGIKIEQVIATSEDNVTYQIESENEKSSAL